MAIREGQAIVVGFLSLDWLGDLADAGSFGRSGRITIADAAGTLIADKERAGVRERVNVSGVSIFSSVPDQRRGSSEFDWSGERRLGSIGYDARRGWRIVVSESIADAYAVTRRVAVESLFGCVLAVLATWGAAWLTGRNLIGSFAALDREAGEVAAGNYREIRVRPYFSEIQAYVRSFNAMTSAVRAREESLARARDEIGAALAEKGVLLREVHHRVMTNLQVISSLVGLQEGSAGGQSAASALRAARLRVQSMALVHEKLYASGDADRIDMAAYLEELAAELRCQYLRPGVVVTVIGEPLELDLVSAIPCGLFAFEALSNSFRHGFPSDRKGSIDIRLSSRDGEARIDISDDGEGMGEASRSGEGLGGQLMASLASQLSGSVTRRVEGAGTRVSLTFPLGPGRGSAAPGAQADEE
jgi:two-component sensor histidine kinase